MLDLQEAIFNGISRLAPAIRALALAAIVLATASCKQNPPPTAASQPPASADAGGHTDGDGHQHGVHDEHVDEVTLTEEAVIRYGVKVERAQLRVLRPTFAAPARVAFNTEAMAHVGSPIRGRVVEVKVRVGDTARKGDVLAVIESPDLGEAQAEHFQRTMAVQTAQPGVDLARLAWERAKALYDRSQGISLTEVQRREAEYRAAIAAQRAAEIAAVGTENRLHLLGMDQAAVTALVSTGELAPRYSITAAIDGQVVEREVTLGELVGPDRESIMVLAQLSTLWVLADVPEARLQEVAVGATAWVSIGSVGSKRFEGVVAFVSPLVDPNTRTAQVRIEVPATALALKPGMFAQVEIAASNGDSALSQSVVAVPDESVQTVEGAPAVFVPVPNEPNTFAKRVVSVGKPVGGLVPVLSGLADGEPFVAAGTFILKAELGKGSAAHEH